MSVWSKHLYRIKRLFGREELKILLDVAPCNLSCAMCPRGGASGLINDSRGKMRHDLFKNIIDKFKREHVRIKEVEIGNWGEPLLNDELPKMIRYLSAIWPPVLSGKPGSIGISTNLNYIKNPEDLLLSGVTRIRVSISGMTQKTYSRNHLGGNIDTVLGNIVTLVDIKNKKNIKNISIGIGYHDLIYNKQEIDSAKKFCQDKGLFFTLLPMYISSVEDNVIFHHQTEKMTKFYESFIDIKKETERMKFAERTEKCQFRRSTITINFDGMIYRCCGVYESKNAIGSFFDFKIRDIPRIKSAICRVCAITPMSWR